MAHNIRIKGSLFFIIIIFSVVFVYNLKPQSEKKNDENIDKDEMTTVLKLSSGKEIYVRAKIWGISSNHEEIVFSETPITIADKEKDYIFYTDEVFYKINAGTLNLYACDCDTSEPTVVFKEVMVILNDLKTSSQVKDYSVNYQKYGLEKISIYEE